MTIKTPGGNEGVSPIPESLWENWNRALNWQARALSKILRAEWAIDERLKNNIFDKKIDDFLRTIEWSLGDEDLETINKLSPIFEELQKSFAENLADSDKKYDAIKTFRDEIVKLIPENESDRNNVENHLAGVVDFLNLHLKNRDSSQSPQIAN